MLQMNEQSPSSAAAKRKAKPAAATEEQKYDYSQFTELWLLVENLQADGEGGWCEG